MSTETPEFEAPFDEEREQLDAELEGESHEATPAPDGEDLDWDALWEFYNFSVDSVISRTQLEGAIMGWPEVSHGPDDAIGLAEDAEDSGLLEKERALADPGAEGEQPSLTLRGFKLADGGEQ